MYSDNPEDYKDFGELESLFECPYTTVNSIRRMPILEKLGVDEMEQQDRKKSFTNILMPYIAEVKKAGGMAAVMENIMGQVLNSPAAAAGRLGSNCMYLTALGDPDDKRTLSLLQEDLARASELDEDKRIEAYKSKMRWIAGRKAVITPRLTACFGGTYNCDSGEYELALQASALPDLEDRQEFTDLKRVWSEFLAGIATSGTQAEWPPRIKSKLDQGDLNELKCYLDEHRELLIQGDQHLKDISDYTGSDQFQSCEDMVDVYKIAGHDLYTSDACKKFIVPALPYLFGAFLAYIVAGSEAAPEAKLVLALTLAGGFAFATSKAIRAPHPAAQRIVDRVDQLAPLHLRQKW